MEVWIESKKITKGLNGDNSPRYSIILRYGFLENGFQRFPATAAQVGKEFAVIEEIPPQDFGYAEDEMPVRYGLIGDLGIHPFSISHDAADPAGFTIQIGDTKIGIATDLGVATGLVCHHLKGCRAMVLEANHDPKMLEEGTYPWELKHRISSRLGHLSNQASRDLLGEVSGEELEHVIVAHISETNNEPGKALSVVGEALTSQSICLSLAKQHEAGELICVDDS